MKLPALKPAFKQPATIALDFIPQRQRPSLIGWLLLACGLLAASAALLEYQRLGERVADNEARLARETRHYERSRVAALARAQEKIPEAELRRAIDQAHSLRRGSASLLASIEAASDKDIALLSLTLQTTKPQFRLGGEARSLEAAFAFAQRLGKQPGIASARIDGHESKPSGSVEVVSFNLSASTRSQP